MKKSSSLPEPVKKKERVQKVLANLGVGSRRSIEVEKTEKATFNTTKTDNIDTAFDDLFNQ